MLADNRFLRAILDRIERSPTRLFSTVIDAQGRDPIDWATLGRLAGGFSALCRDRRIASGGTVMIFLPVGRSLYGAFLGSLLQGLVPSIMPLLSSRQDPRLFWSSHAELLRRLEPAVIVASSSTLSEMREAGLPLAERACFRIEDLREADAAPPRPRDDSSVAVLQHSSGTTGLKKGIALTFRAITDQLDSYARALDLSEADSISSWLPLYHDMGFVACLLLPLYRGLQIDQIDPFHWTARPSSLLEAMDGRVGSLAWMPNFGFEHLARTVRAPETYRLSGVKALINCSEPCKTTTMDRFLTKMAPSGLGAHQLGCCYALAENTFAVAQTPVGQVPRRVTVDAGLLGIGQLPMSGEGRLEIPESGLDLEGVDARVVDDVRAPVPDGVVGEIAIRGRSLFDGYHLDPARTASRLDRGTFYTGDLGFRHGGRLFVLGRVDDQIIVNGRNHYAHELESALADVAGLKPGRILAASRGSEVTGTSDLVIVAECDTGADHDALRRSILSLLQSVFAVEPTSVEFRPPGWLIKTTSGKIARRANLNRYEAERP